MLRIFKTVGGRFQCVIKATEDARFIIFILTQLRLDMIVVLQLFLQDHLLFLQLL